jgi:hypothetical protein
MISLSESLVCRPILEKYNASVDNFGDLPGKSAPWDAMTSDEQAVATEWLKKVFGDEVCLIVSDKQEVIKIPRYLAPRIDSTKHGPEIEVQVGAGTDRSLYIVRGAKRHKFAVTGSGSIGRVTTAAQESATCLIWNAFVLDPAAEHFDIKSKQQVADCVRDLSGDFDAAWINSFQEQIQAIITFMLSRGIKKDDIIKYRACRYGEKDLLLPGGKKEDTKTGKAHEEFLKAYMDKIEAETGDRGQKDNFDPSDIVLYLPGEGVMNIFNKLKTQCTKDTSSEDMIEAYRELFNKNLMFGISLKKCSGKGSYELFNLGRQSDGSVRVTKVENWRDKTHSSANQSQLKVMGSFNLSGISDPDDPEKHIQEKEVLVTLRSFGGSNAMDVKETSGPAIGKVPVRMWTSALKVQEKDLEGAIKKFDEFVDKKHYKELADLIAGGMKNGPWCLPFVLIH